MSLRVLLAGDAEQRKETCMRRPLCVRLQGRCQTVLGLYPRKGALRIGSDADVVLVDTEQEHVLSNDNIVSKAGWTPFDGRRVKGRPVMTMLRGQVVAEYGEVAAEPGGGRFVIRR